MRIVQKPIAWLTPYPDNPRHNESAIGKVAASIAEFGFQQPIVTDAAGVVIVGHTRLAAAKQLGLDLVPVLVASELTPEQARAYRIADNRTNEDASWDSDKLLTEIQALMDDAFDIDLLGFTDDEIAALQAARATTEGATDPDELPEPEGVAISRPGDVWDLGRHRVVCGDSTDPTAVRAALDGRLADLVWIYPPYNVDYTGGTAKSMKIKNDNQPADQYRAFLVKSMSTLCDATKPGGCVYIAHQDQGALVVRQAMAAAGWEHKQTLIWVKNSAVLSRQDYNWRHEPILYGRKPGAAHYFAGDYTLQTVLDDAPDTSKLSKPDLLAWCQRLEQQLQDTVHREKRPDVADMHPTMKPVALVARHIEASSKPGQTVLDGFGGSGTTLIAAETTGRRAALVELDQTYTDVIVRRWQAFTEQDATLEASGQTFQEVADARTQAETDAA